MEVLVEVAGEKLSGSASRREMSADGGDVVDGLRQLAVVGDLNCRKVVASLLVDQRTTAWVSQDDLESDVLIVLIRIDNFDGDCLRELLVIEDNRSRGCLEVHAFDGLVFLITV